MDSSLNKKKLIEYIVGVNIHDQKYRERTKINMIKEQKWKVILEILQLVCHSPGIDQRIGEVKIIRYLEGFGKQQRPKQGKLEQQKKKKKKETRRKEVEKKKPKKKRTIKVKKIAEKQKIWNKEKEAAKSKQEVKKLVSQIFHKQIHTFEKKTSEKMLMKKV